MPTKVKNKIIITAIVAIITIAAYWYTINRSHKYTFKYFQTAIIINLHETEKKLSSNIINQIDDLLKVQEKKWLNKPGHYITELNQKLLNPQYFTVDNETIKIIQIIQNFYKKSDRYFNPMMGMLFNYWENYGINKQNIPELNLNKYLKNAPTPNDIQIKVNPNTNNFSIKNTNPFLQLNIDVIISAHILSQIKEILIANNIKNAELTMDDELYLIKKDTHQNYEIIKTHTNSNKMPTLNITTYDEEFIAVSGVLVRHRANKNKANKIINPKIGKPSYGFYGATVIDKDPYKANIASMTLILAGEQEYKSIAKSLDITNYILYTYDNKIIISNDMLTRLAAPA